MTGKRALWHPGLAAAFLLAVLFPTQAASDKNGLAPNTISLPKGPGSIEGLGEAFQPALNTGTGKHSVPLKMPPGTAGHAPNLSLVYEGGSGSGILGLGWSFPMAFVQRQTDKGIPRYVDGLNGVDDDFDGILDEPDELDNFINESSERLVPIQDGGQVSFFCENEAAFIRYRRIADYWEGVRPDGTRLVFGQSPGARIADPADVTHIFRWLLETETDTRGNIIRYRHTMFADNTNSGQVYLQGIEYGPGVPPWGGACHFAFLTYEDRADWFEDCRAGFPVRTGKRLREIAIGTQGVLLAAHSSGDFNLDGTADCLNRRYVIGYQAGLSHSLLASITHFGADATSRLPSVTYGYTQLRETNEISAADAWIVSTNTPPVAFDTGLADFIDLNGDGLPDLLRTSALGGAHTVYFNHGESDTGGHKEIRWSDPEAVANTPGAGDPWSLGLEADEVVLSDADGDGMSDLVQMTPFGTYYFPNSPAANGTALWGERRSLGATDYIPPSPFGSGGSVRTLDVDFDKRTDIIKSISVGGGFRYQIWFNRGGNSFSMRTTVAPPKGYDLTLAAVQLADLNGDGLQDVSWIRPSEVLFTASLGHGRFLPERSIAIPGVRLTSELIAKASLRDVNGDGLADLVVDRPAPQTLWIWLNRANLSFRDQIVITGLPASLNSGTAVRWADINGNGTVDMVFGDTSRDNPNRLLSIDVGRLLGAVPRAGLLNSIDNGIGRLQTLAYETSTRYALADGTNFGAYRYSWPHPLPFPVEVVSEVRTCDSLSSEYRTRFAYHDGYYDSTEKQFRGFARVEQIDVGDSTAPTLITRSWFDTGHDYKAMKGRLVGLATVSEDGHLFYEEDSAWTIPPITLYTSTNGQPVNFVHPTGKTNRVVELGQGIERRVESEMDFDSFGNQIRQSDYGIVLDGDRSAYNDERITVTEYAINTNAWILRLPARQETQDEQGVVLSRTAFFYDDETFSGNNRGLVAIGNLTMKREWKDPANAGAFVESARTKYDAYGNPATIFDPLGTAPDPSQGHAREIAHDSKFHTFPVSETINLGGSRAPLVVRAGYDEGFGTVTTSTDFNANPTAYGYDAFARPTTIIKPGDSPEYPTVEYDYALAVSAGVTSLVNYVEVRQLDQLPGTIGSKRDHYSISRQFVDGLGRKLMTKTEAEPEPGSSAPRAVVSDATQFNARQKPSRVLNPFFSLSGGTLDELLAFEVLEAPGWQGQFHIGGSLVALDLASAQATLTNYDATLRITQVRSPDGTFRRTVYEPLLIRSFDENQTDPASPYFGCSMVHRSDGLGRLVQVDEITKLNDNGTQASELHAWPTRYEYDLNDQLTRITDSQGNVRTFTFDGLKRKTGMNDPDRGVMRCVFDDASNLIETTDAKDQSITCTYDGANRIRTEKYHDGQPAPPWRDHTDGEALTNSVVYHYDTPRPNLPQGDNSLDTARNVKGALAWVEDLSGEEHPSYDSRGRIESVVKRIPDPRFLSLLPSSTSRLIAYATRFAYDSLDRLTTLAYPDGDRLHYDYNERSLVQRIQGGQPLAGGIISGIAYQPSGQIGQIDYGNSVRSTCAYDSRLRLTNLLTVAQPATLNQQLIHFGYEFDGVSNIRSIVDLRPSSAVPEGSSRRNTQLFQYDSLYRLTRLQCSFGLTGDGTRNDGEINHRYDRVGNLLSQTSTLTNHLEKGLPAVNLGALAFGGAAGCWNRIGRAPADPPGPHALSQISSPQAGITNRIYPYDANGNTLNIDGLACTWDFKDRLVAVEDSEMRAAYVYDYADRRIMKRVWSKTTNSAPTSPLASVLYINKYFEVREHDAPAKYVWNGSTRVAKVTGSLSTNVHVQRLRIWPGWNLCSLAVTTSAAPLKSQISNGQWFRWSSLDKKWVSVADTDTLAAGTVFWLQSPANASLTASGAYSDPENRDVPPEGDFLPSAGLEAWDLKPEIDNLPTATAWIYDAFAARWLSWLPPPLQAQSDLPSFIAPGEAVFVRTATSTRLEVPASTRRIHYYHQDHLGSSSVLTDGTGNTIQEIAYFPFGQPRNASQPAGPREPYLFTEKEKDAESGLSYFEARFQIATSGRFASVDPLAESLPAGWLPDPQRLGSYAYARNNPLRYLDPSGKGDPPTGDPNSRYALVSGAAKEFDVRRSLARAYYTAHTDWDSVRIESHLRGIDFTHEVTVVEIPEGATLRQFQGKDKEGKYYPTGTYFVTTDTELTKQAGVGINPKDRGAFTYGFEKGTTALMSTAIDTQNKDWPEFLQGPGKLTQFFVPEKAKAAVVAAPKAVQDQKR